MVCGDYGHLESLLYTLHILEESKGNDKRGEMKKDGWEMQKGGKKEVKEEQEKKDTVIREYGGREAPLDGHELGVGGVMCTRKEQPMQERDVMLPSGRLPYRLN